MSEKSEALQLADALEISSNHGIRREAAAELRFLHEKCEALTADTIEEMGRIVEIRRLTAQRDALLEALKDAATSLETVGRLAGKSDYLGDDGERIPTYMGRHDEVREYAISRAGVARAAIKMVEEGK